MAHLLCRQPVGSNAALKVHSLLLFVIQFFLNVGEEIRESGLDVRSVVVHFHCQRGNVIVKRHRRAQRSAGRERRVLHLERERPER